MSAEYVACLCNSLCVNAGDYHPSPLGMTGVIVDEFPVASDSHLSAFAIKSLYFMSILHLWNCCVTSNSAPLISAVSNTVQGLSLLSCILGGFCCCLLVLECVSCLSQSFWTLTLFSRAGAGSHSFWEQGQQSLPWILHNHVSIKTHWNKTWTADKVTSIVCTQAKRNLYWAALSL